jgi:hypothetical protein
VPSPTVPARPPPVAATAALPQLAPPAPTLAPLAPLPQSPAPAAAGRTVLTISPAKTLDDSERADIARVAGLYKAKPGTVAVIAYAAAPAPGGDPLAAYHAALDRAQQVATALAEAGIPAGKIQAQATPVASGGAPGRVDIRFAP